MRSLRHLNVTTRVTLWNVAILALAMLAMGAVVRLSVAQNLTASIDRELEARVHRISRDRGGSRLPTQSNFTRRSSIWSLISPGNPLTPLSGVDGGAEPSSTAIRRQPISLLNSRWRSRIFDRKGHPLYGGSEPPWDSTTLAAALAGREVFSTTQSEGESIRVLSVPLQRRNESGVVQGAYSLGDVERALANLNKTLLTLIPVALLAAWSGGMFLTGRMMRPLRQVTSTAAGISAADLSRRLPVAGAGRDEFSDLAVTFNEMLGRLERAFEQQRRFVADASHELRTPLTVIKANTSLVLSQGNLPARQKQSLESVDRAAGMMASVVQDLLLLARSDAGQLELNLRPTLVRDVIEAAAACTRKDGAAAIVNTAIDVDMLVQADATHLTRLFVNLLDNSIRHTPPTGSISILAERLPDSTIEIAVVDTGAGISPEHLPFICDRFYRADASRARAHGGTGLGLAICQSIVAAHHGTMRIESSLTTGTTVRVRLPDPGPLD